MVFGEQDGWYLIWYKNTKGWAKKEWLWAFRSLNAAKYTIPGCEPETGAVSLRETQWISAEGFSGVEAAPGAILTVYRADEEAYTLRVWRGETALESSAGEWTPFTPWQEAQPGGPDRRLYHVLRSTFRRAPARGAPAQYRRRLRAVERDGGAAGGTAVLQRPVRAV